MKLHGIDCRCGGDRCRLIPPRPVRKSQGDKMKPFQRSCCAVCGRFVIEHDSDPKEVRCGDCGRWIEHRRAYVDPITIKPSPPPTTEFRNSAGIPTDISMALQILFCVFAFLWGWILRGSM